MKNLAEEIAKTREIIRQKYAKLREQSSGIRDEFAKTYKPIIEPLEKIARNQGRLNNNNNDNNNNNNAINNNQEEEEEVEGVAEDVNRNIVVSRKRKLAEASALGDNSIFQPEKYARLDDYEEEEEEEEEANETVEEEENDDWWAESSLYEFMPNANELGREFMELLFHSSNKIDHTYGPHYDRNELRIGDKRLELNEKINIGNRAYDGTRGLYELIFLKNPRNVTAEDVANYHEILNYTNSNRNADGRPKSNRGPKYKKFVANSLNKKNGGGLKDMSVKDNTEYIYWDDPGEMVDRLQLLISERNAGHTGLENEISSILEELEESGLIIKKRAFRINY